MNPNQYLRLPGIELILRLRLRQINDNYPTDEEIRLLSYLGLVGNEIDAVALTQANSTQEIEARTLNDLVKIYKGLIHQYLKNIEKIEKVYTKIIWVPATNAGGPEKGTSVSTRFVVYKRFHLHL